MSIKHLYEDERPSLLLNFANSKTLDPRITFERQSIGTYVDEKGIIKTAADNEARIDHDPVTSECRGLLIEDGSTNYFRPDTQLIGTGGFTSIGSGSRGLTESATPTTQLTPDGSTAAYRYELSNVNESHALVRVTGGGGATEPNTDWGGNTQNGGLAFSIFVKPDGWSKFILIMHGSGGVQPTLRVAFDLSINTTAPVEYGYSDVRWEPTHLAVQAYPDGWYRLQIAAKYPISFRIYTSLIPYDTLPTNFEVKDPNSTNQFTYNTTTGYPSAAFSPGQSGLGFYACFSQIEVKKFCSSYIPCGGTVTSRLVDEAEITGTNFSNWYNQSEGTFVVSAKSTSGHTVLPFFTTASSSNINYQNIGIWRYENTSLAAGKRIEVFNRGSGSWTTIELSSENNGVPFKAAVGYGTDIAASYDGGTALSGTLQVISPDKLCIGARSSTAGLSYISSLYYYNTRLSDSKLEALTK